MKKEKKIVKKPEAKIPNKVPVIKKKKNAKTKTNKIEPKAKVTLEQISDKVYNYGLDYAVLYYVHEDDIEDSNLAEMWKEARSIFEEILEYLKVEYKQ